METVVETFQAFRRILCICPHCGELKRLSDLQIHYEGKTEPTWLDTFETKLLSLQKKKEKFDEKEAELREKAHERGRKKVPLVINTMMAEDLARFKFDPYDIKSVFHPVDFIVFDGMNAEEKVKEVLLLARKNKNLESLHSSVKQCVKDHMYQWKVARAQVDGTIEIK